MNFNVSYQWPDETLAVEHLLVYLFNVQYIDFGIGKQKLFGITYYSYCVRKEDKKLIIVFGESVQTCFLSGNVNHQSLPE